MTQLCLSFPASRKKEKLSFHPSNFFGQLKLLSTKTRRKLQTSLLFSHYLCILGIPPVLIENGTLLKGAAKLERKTFLISSYTLTHHFVYSILIPCRRTNSTKSYDGRLRLDS